MTSSASVHSGAGTKVVYARTIVRSAEALYDLCRSPGWLLLIFRRPPAVTEKQDGRIHVVSPDGDWQVIVSLVTDRRPEVISWKSEEGSDLAHAGTIRFDPAPGGDGTEVTVTLEYEGGGGKLGELWSKLTHRGPAGHVADALRRFKAHVETGEIPTIEGQPVGEPQKSKRSRP